MLEFPFSSASFVPTFHGLCMLFLDLPPALACLAWTLQGRPLIFQSTNIPALLACQCGQIHLPKASIQTHHSPTSPETLRILSCPRCLQNRLPVYDTAQLTFSHLPHAPSCPVPVVSPCFPNTHALCFPASVPLPLLLL